MTTNITLPREVVEQALSTAGFYDPTWVGDRGDLENLIAAALSAAAEPVKVPQEVAQAHLLAEDIESFHIAMDKAGVPRSDDTDKVYSMYGRALRLAETMLHGKLWLWKNFVNGRPEYWAFDNPYPVRMDCGDPQTLGEPCGYAIFKPSRNGRPDAPQGALWQVAMSAFQEVDALRDAIDLKDAALKYCSDDYSYLLGITEDKDNLHGWLRMRKANTDLVLGKKGGK